MSNHLINDTEQALRSARQLQERFAHDPYRPRFHFLPPGGWLNDPTGALYWRGRYHLFYQYYPDAAYSVIEHRDQLTPSRRCAAARRGTAAATWSTTAGWRR